jgi:glycosyltransferase involved in cell wall biosynthesis
MTARSNGADVSGRDAPRVAIVIPAYNGERFIGAALDSLLAQTWSDWRAVVFDDGSSDRTVDVASTYASDPRITVESGPNGGVASARNRGLAATSQTADYVIFLDQDDVWDSDALESLVNVLDERSDYVAVHSLARSINSDGRPYPGDNLAELTRQRTGLHGGKLVTISLDGPTTFNELVVHNWILTPGTLLIRREVLERAGPFDVSTVPTDDWDLAIRISRYGPIGFIDRPLLQWRRHDAAYSHASPGWRGAYFRSRDKTLIDPTNTDDQRRAARRAYVNTAHATLHDVVRVQPRRPAAIAKQLGRAVYAYARFGLASMRAATVRMRHR